MDQIILPNCYQQEQYPRKSETNGEIFTCSKDLNLYAMKVFKKNKQQYLHVVNFVQLQIIIKLIDNLEQNANRVIILEQCPKDHIKYQIENLQIDCKCINPQLKIQILWIYIFRIEIQLNDLNIYLINLLNLIKPENLMIGNDNMIRIIDFEESRISDMIIQFKITKLNRMNI